MMQWMKTKKIGKARGITMDEIQVKVKGKVIFVVEGRLCARLLKV